MFLFAIWTRLTASITGMKPLSASSSKQVMPYFLPMTRSTLVAPMLPEPWSRMLMPLALAMIRPKGIDPSRKASNGQSQSCITRRWRIGG